MNLALTPVWGQDLTQLPLDSLAQAAQEADSSAELQEDSETKDMLTADHDSPDTVEYSAYDLQYDFATRTFNLNSKAQLKYRGSTLDADTILYNQSNDVIQASGNPVLRDLQNPPLAGYRMKYNLRNKIGEIYYGTSTRESQRFNGMILKRLPDGRLQLARGDFSTCDSTHQHYYFYARRMIVKPKENVVARPVVLNIADVPVAVLPLLVSPLKSGRRSGLLTPKFGGDQAQGFYLRNLGVYWAINDYMDWQASGDIVEGSEARFERSSLSSKFQYKKRYLLDGNISAQAYLEEFDMGNSQWDVRFSHNQNLRPDGKSKITGSGSFVSNASTRKERGLTDTTILDQQANAHLEWVRYFENNRSLTIRAQQEHNLTTGVISRQFPNARFIASGGLFDFIPESNSLSSNEFLERFRYSLTNRSNLYQKQAPDTTLDKDTSRVWAGNSLSFDLSWTGQLFNVINITPKAHLKNDWTAYRWENPQDSANRHMAFAADVTQGETGLFYTTHSYSITGDTKLYGIWRPEWKRFSGIRHIISPSISYTYAPEKDTLYTFAPHPKLSQSYYQNESKTVGFSLGNDLDLKYLSSSTSQDSTSKSKKKGTNLRLLSTRHSTGYNFAKDSVQWSPITSSFSIQLVPSYIFSIRTTHNVYHLYEPEPHKVRIPQLTSWSYSLGKDFKWSGDLASGNQDTKDKLLMLPWSASVNYRYSFSSTRVGRKLFQDKITHSSNMSLSLRPTQLWTMSYNTYYNFTDGEFAKHSFRFTRDLHCWGMNFSWTPVGAAAGWHFEIYIKDIPDIRLQAGNTET